MNLGDVVPLGNHRLMCGDAGDPEHVAKLFDGIKPDLVFTSPPYAQQRDYTQKIACWDTLMQRVFGAMPHHDTTQVLVNLGLAYRKGEWIPYWDAWLEWMRAQAWRRFAWYIWDKGPGLPMNPRIGRLYPSFECIFHFCRKSPTVNRITPSKCAGYTYNSVGVRDPNGMPRKKRDGPRHIMPYRVPDDIFRITRHHSGEHGQHPAVFPIALPAAIHAIYTNPGQVVYDPFVGSGTSILAAEQQNRICYAMDIAPEYCQIAIDRWRKVHPCT